MHGSPTEKSVSKSKKRWADRHRSSFDIELSRNEKKSPGQRWLCVGPLVSELYLPATYGLRLPAHLWMRICDVLLSTCHACFFLRADEMFTRKNVE